MVTWGLPTRKAHLRASRQHHRTLRLTLRCCSVLLVQRIHASYDGPYNVTIIQKSCTVTLEPGVVRRALLEAQSEYQIAAFQVAHCCVLFIRLRSNTTLHSMSTCCESQSFSILAMPSSTTTTSTVKSFSADSRLSVMTPRHESSL